MTNIDPTVPTASDAPIIDQAAPSAHASTYGQVSAQMPGGYVQQSMATGHAPIGQVRSTGVCILLAIITFGIYSIVWFYKVHAEMKSHTNGGGIGGGVAALLAFFVGIVMPYLTASEVGNLYRRAGMSAPVSGATGLWYFPGMFILIGPLVWFVKTNAALNSYWRSQGAA